MINISFSFLCHITLAAWYNKPFFNELTTFTSEKLSAQKQPRSLITKCRALTVSWPWCQIIKDLFRHFMLRPQTLCIEGEREKANQLLDESGSSWKKEICELSVLPLCCGGGLSLTHHRQRTASRCHFLFDLPRDKVAGFHSQEVDSWLEPHPAGREIERTGERR